MKKGIILFVLSVLAMGMFAGSVNGIVLAPCPNGDYVDGSPIAFNESGAVGTLTLEGYNPGSASWGNTDYGWCITIDLTSGGISEVEAKSLDGTLSNIGSDSELGVLVSPDTQSFVGDSAIWHWNTKVNYPNQIAHLYFESDTLSLNPGDIDITDIIFTVPLSGGSGEAGPFKSGGPGPGPIPEFSTTGIIVALLVIIAGAVLVIKRKK